MRAHEILMENTDVLKVPGGMWKQVTPQEHHLWPTALDSPYMRAVLDKITTKAWELHTPKGMISVLSTHSPEIRHIHGYEEFTPTELKQNLAPLIIKLGLTLPNPHDLVMTPEQQLVYVSKEHPPKKVVRTPDAVWFTVDQQTYRDFYAKPWTHAQLPDQVPGDLYFRMKNSRDVPSALVVVRDGVVQALSGYVQAPELKILLDHIHVKDSVLNTHMNSGKTYIRDGEVLHTEHLLQTQPKGELSDQSKVYEVEPKYRWLVPVWFYKTYANADRIYVVIGQPGKGRAVFAVKQNKIVGKSTLSASPSTMKKWSQLLPSDVALGIETPESSQIKPNSVLHKMLRYIKESPGGNRTDVFVRGLGRKSTLGAGSIQDATTPDGMAWAAGLIQPFRPGTDKYEYKITPKGIMVLAALDAGKSIKENSLIDWAKK